MHCTYRFYGFSFIVKFIPRDFGKRCSYFTKSFGYFNVPFLLLCSQTIDINNIRIISITATIFTILLRNKKKKNPTFRNL